jgi:hypothetical protein
VGGTSNQATVTISVTPTRFWQNQTRNLDVNNDGQISPIDVLQIVNRLNSSGAGALPVPSPGFAPPPFYDVNGDGNITPADALVVINAINDGNTGAEGEGEAEGELFTAPANAEAQSFAVQVSPVFTEYRYVPLAQSARRSPQTNELNAATSWFESTHHQVDVAVADLADQESDSTDSTSADLNLIQGDAASCLDTIVADSTHYDSAVDQAFDALFGDIAE